MPDTETKRDRFARVATRRVNAAISAMDALGKLSDSSSYEYTSQDVEKMFAAVQTAIDAASNRFVNSRSKFSF